MGKFGLKNWSSPNWLKFGTGAHILLMILKFIFRKLFSLMIFGQIWSHNLDVFKLTKISQRVTLLYAYYRFNVYFFKILFIHIFWANLVPYSEVLQIYWNFLKGYITISLLQFWCLFFQKFCHSYNFGQNLMLSQLTGI